ncbi:RDD family protein [Tumebacillus avium]|uniref:RDD family protein n=1 Tax=Tumebacillus avium TaxID=1903704 RepID=UPI0012FD56AB|nr:RDD family protein [Tumebacillus avium]
MNTGHYAGFWLRFIAVFLDGLVVSGFTTILGKITFGVGIKFEGLIGEVFLNIMSFAIPWLYFAFMESSVLQGTLGKKILGLAVVDLHGNRISLGKATVRHFSKILSFATLLIGFIMIGVTSQKQGLHDKLANCLVLRGRWGIQSHSPKSSI